MRRLWIEQWSLRQAKMGNTDWLTLFWFLYLCGNKEWCIEQAQKLHVKNILFRQELRWSFKLWLYEKKEQWVGRKCWFCGFALLKCPFESSRSHGLLCDICLLIMASPRMGRWGSYTQTWFRSLVTKIHPPGLAPLSKWHIRLVFLTLLNLYWYCIELETRI